MNKYQISPEIIHEATFFVQSVWQGIIIGFAYDCIRIFRRVFIHRHWMSVWIEDILFWCIAGIAIFSLCFDKNDGILRLFCGIGIAMGAAIYGSTLSRLYIKYTSKILLFLLKPLKLLTFMVKMKIVTFVKSLIKKRRPDEVRNKQTEE